MDDILGFVFAVLLLVPLGLGLVGLYRVVNPYARKRRGTGRELLGAVGWFLLFAVSAVLVIPAAVSSAPEAARRSQCVNNLKQIVVAMRSYADAHGSFPPAYTVDKDGLPLHSWRVLLLPFLEQKPLYDRVRLDEPYDSPWNRTLFESLKMPQVFSCPSDKENRTDTNYVMILGPRTISTGPNSVRLKDITDGAPSTIAVVETYDFCIRWYEPRDLRADRMSFKINDAEYVGIASRHPGGVQVAFVDRHCVFLHDKTDPRAVEAMTTINGGEDVSAVLK